MNEQNLIPDYERLKTDRTISHLEFENSELRTQLTEAQAKLSRMQESNEWLADACRYAIHVVRIVEDSCYSSWEGVASKCENALKHTPDGSRAMPEEIGKGMWEALEDARIYIYCREPSPEKRCDYKNIVEALAAYRSWLSSQQGQKL